jgi:hypothetical protein
VYADDPNLRYNPSAGILYANIANLVVLNTSTYVSATGNIIAGNILSNGIASVFGNVTGGNVSTAGNVSAGNVVVSSAVFNASSLPNGGTINSSYNAMMAGPITVNNGSVFTVQTILIIV